MASASATAELEAGLQAMLNLKPPGVSGSRITTLTKLCVDNVQSESILVQKLFMHFKKAPISHKLGVLYVVDSVTRKWYEQAKASGQHVDSSAPDGTFAAGVHRVTELMPVLMNDILQFAPEGQKDKISKLLDIWEKGQTFSPAMIESFRQKLKAVPELIQSTTPEGSPPPGLVAFMGYNRPAAPSAPTPPTAQNSSAIMAALANIARQNNAAAPAQPPVPAKAQHTPQSQAQTNALSILANLQNVAAQQQQSASRPAAPPQQPYSLPYTSQPATTTATPLSAPVSAAFNYASPQPPAQAPSQPVGMPYLGAVAPAQPQPPALPMDPRTQQQLLLIKTLRDQGVPLEQIPALLAAFSAQPGAAPGATPAAVSGAPAASATPAPNYYAASQGWNGPGQSNDSRDSHRYSDGPRSPNHYQRSRSRSPGRQWDSRNPSRGSPHGSRDDYHRHSPNRGRYDDRDGRGRVNDYRQRSPVGRNGRSPTPRRHPGEKWVEYDPSIGNGKIKVFSRTLFVGGVNYSERELREIFSKYGQVQTCIVNKDKRHAFVKMISRDDASRAKEAMEANRDSDPQLRTRWGVGFGPRDCSDYQTGISIIPISKLTEADRKWMLTAEYGGSGGKPIESGLCVEEPDIEIGAGVSSKAISRRMQTDKSGNHGPRSTRSGRHDQRDGDADDGHDEYGRNRRGGRDRREDKQASGANAQPVTQYPFGIGTLPNGMPAYPANFMFPAPESK